MNRYLILLVGFVLFAGGCGRKADNAAQLNEVKVVINGMIHAIESEDMGLLSKLFAHDEDMVNFGSDAAERWVGWDALKDSVQKQFNSFDKTKLTVRDQVVKISPLGDAAWFSETVDWDLIAEGQPTQLKGTRLTGVLEKRKGNWVIVQFHGSVPVSTQAAKY